MYTLQAFSFCFIILASWLKSHVKFNCELEVTQLNISYCVVHNGA